MPAFDVIRETLRKHSGKIVSSIGAALVTPLIARIASRWTGKAVDTVWQYGEENQSDAVGAGAEAHQEGAEETAASTVQTRAGQPEYEEWTKKELYSLAQDLDIYGRSTMNKAELIQAIRDHEEKD